MTQTINVYSILTDNINPLLVAARNIRDALAMIAGEPQGIKFIYEALYSPSSHVFGEERIFVATLRRASEQGEGIHQHVIAVTLTKAIDLLLCESRGLFLKPDIASVTLGVGCRVIVPEDANA